MFLLLLTLSAFGSELPPEAQALLNSLPEKRLTLDLVAHRALGMSDSYKGVLADTLSADAPRLRVNSLFDPKLAVKLGWQDDKREPNNGFSPTRIYGTTYSATVSKYFLTGSALTFELAHHRSNIVLPTFGDQPAVETRGTVSLSQNLWKDAFGTASRSSLGAAEEAANANAFAIEEGKEDWFDDISRIYYGAWLSQAQYEAAKQSLKRRERLMKTLGIRFARGTSEAPNVLQVESALKTTKVEVAKAFQTLGNQWRALGTILKFPPAIEGVDPSLIPISLDKPYEKAKTACGPLNKFAEPPKATARIERISRLSKAAELNYESASSENNPSLQLLASLGTNAVEPDSSSSFSEFGKNRFPYLAVGLELSVPFGFSAENAKYFTASADKIKLAASLALAQDTLKVEWRNFCLDLYRLEEARNLYEEAFRSQEKRERLEEKRFGVGRSTTFEVIQAGDDATSAELALRAAEVEYRATAWKINRFSGLLKEYLKELANRK